MLDGPLLVGVMCVCQRGYGDGGRTAISCDTTHNTGHNIIITPSSHNIVAASAGLFTYSTDALTQH